MKVINWNTEWAKPGSTRGHRVAAQIAAHRPDIACLTEAYPRMASEGGHEITSSDETGYENEGGRRKVLLWSSEPWTDSWQAEGTGLPGGRFISGVTSGIRIVGLCIPWSMAHVTTGRRDRKPWEDHLAYLEALSPVLADFLTKPEPLLVTGDWNQRIPKTRQPAEAFTALVKAMEGLSIVTSGTLPEVNELLIDHLALSPSLAASDILAIPKRDEAGKPLSDHLGYALKIASENT
ncbi:MAG: endonuclease/exonuclease/phosphatase family protein [Verrucomicrobiales bacterium]|nr:endonuclease/exonuclease/phosphatase family protein [Verrucomicrobiales bacterium]